MNFFQKADVTPVGTLPSLNSEPSFGSSTNRRATSEQIVDIISRQHGEILTRLESLDIALSHPLRRNREKVINTIQELGTALDHHSLDEDNLVYKRLLASISPDSDDYRRLQSIERAEKSDRQRVFNFFLKYRKTNLDESDCAQLKIDFRIFSHGIIGHMDLEENMLLPLLEQHLH